MLMTKSTRPRSISSTMQPPSPAGVSAPAIVKRDRRVVLRQQHLVGEDAARLAQPRGVERLKALVDQMPDVGAAARAVVADRLAGQVIRAGFLRRSGRTIGHRGLA